MKVLSLFSGVGGFDMGLEAAGMQTVFQCEWDKHCRSVLDRHWANVPKWSDISTLTGKHILDHAPDIDVVAWGSPCQDLSKAGKQAGLSGGRSGLFYEGIRIIKELREETNGKYPRFSIWENVAGAINSNKGADFGQSLMRWQKQGRWSLNGNCWTQNTLESPKQEGVCSLSLASILINQNLIPSRYFLSTKAIQGILKREMKSVSINLTEYTTSSMLDSQTHLRRSLLAVLLVKHLNQEN